MQLLRGSAACLLAAAVLCCGPLQAQDRGTVSDAELLRAMRSGGHVILIRHASTVPGIGDPAGFVLTDCATQRNLSEAGRAEAVRIGTTFKAERIPVGRVQSSRWCRCLDTARLAFGKVSPWPALDSHFDNPADGAAQAAAVISGIAERETAGENLVLVTHQVNISALTGVSPAQGEAVVTRLTGKSLRVVGRLRPAGTSQ